MTDINDINDINDITTEYFNIYGHKFISECEFAEFIVSHVKSIIDFNNADEFIYECRKISWELYQNIEDSIISPKRKILTNISSDQTIPVREWKEQIIKCIQSIQQARKNRSGKSLEYIMSKLLKLNNIEHYLQNFNGIKGDIIIPSNDGYILIECKSTLRERWEQILRAKKQKKVMDVFVVTCIEKVQPEKVKEIYEQGLQLYIPLSIQGDENLSINTMIEKIKNHTHYYTCIDLFCGAGGLTLGFENAKIRSLVGIEIDEIFAETYISNGNRQIINKDICQVGKAEIDKYIRGKQLDIIIGGPSCQGFSMAGGRDPKDPRNSLFREYCRILRYYQPKIFIMENVVGILSMKMEDGNKVFDVILDEFNKVGYNVKYAKLNSADYGVPQKRIRVIIVGVHKSIKSDYNFPDPTHLNPETNNDNEIFDWVPIKNVLIPQEDVDKSYFHSQKMIDGFNSRKIANKVSGKGFGVQFANMDKPSYTISARYYKDGADCIIKYSDTCMRKLTELEITRIQTFPDDYIFTGSKSKIYTQIGNAVPVLLAQRIGENIKTFLDELSKEDKESYEQFIKNNAPEDDIKMDDLEYDEEETAKLQSLTVDMLKSLCKKRGIIGISKCKKAELITKLKNVE